GKIEGGRRFRRARDADKDDLRLIKIVGHLAVIVRHGEVERLYPAEVVFIQDMLTPRKAADFLAQKGGKSGEDGIEHRNARYTDAFAAELQNVAHFLADQRIEDEARLAHDRFKDIIELTQRSRQGPDMFDRGDAFKLDKRHLGHGLKRFAG